MTMEEASTHYRIPLRILREYERWGLRDAGRPEMGRRQYDDTDLKHLSAILTLHDIGFSSREAETYMRLLLEGRPTETQRLAMLEKKRGAVLEEIHRKERQLQRLDYLRHEIRKAQGSPGK